MSRFWKLIIAFVILLGIDLFTFYIFSDLLGLNRLVVTLISDFIASFFLPLFLSEGKKSEVIKSLAFHRTVLFYFCLFGSLTMLLYFVG